MLHKIWQLLARIKHRSKRPKWEREVESILGNVPPPETDIRNLVESIMPLAMFMLTLAVGQDAIYTPKGRELLREALAEQGVPSEKIDGVIDWMMRHFTKAMWEKGA